MLLAMIKAAAAIAVAARRAAGAKPTRSTQRSTGRRFFHSSRSRSPGRTSRRRAAMRRALRGRSGSGSGSSTGCHPADGAAAKVVSPSCEANRRARRREVSAVSGRSTGLSYPVAQASCIYQLLRAAPANARRTDSGGFARDPPPLRHEGADGFACDAVAPSRSRNSSVRRAGLVSREGEAHSTQSSHTPWHVQAAASSASASASRELPDCGRLPWLQSIRRGRRAPRLRQLCRGTLRARP